MQIPSPCYILEEQKLIDNAALLKDIQLQTGIQVILALKGFAMWSAFPILRPFLKTCTASSLHEALLCHEKYGSKAHTYSPAYRPGEIDQILKLSSHITFNSYSQFEQFKTRAAEAGVSCGIRINPEYSDVETELYNPCSPGTRLGTVSGNLPKKLDSQIEGLHFHALCESDSYAFERTLAAFEQRTAQYLPHLKWVNFGGGHLITSAKYNIPHLIELIKVFKQRYPNLHVIMEPGSAVAWQAGYLHTTVLDIVENNGIRTAILDASFTAHMPDTLEMPYRPKVRNALDPADYPHGHAYRLGGMSCLAGDFLYEYAFDQPLSIGDAVILEDMIHYTMVKTTTFNGVPHPSIAILRKDGKLDVVRDFYYADFKNRLS